MTVLYVILLAIVQGITEFLPVSSFGHLSILENFFLFSAGEKYGSGSDLQKSICKGTEWKYQLF